MSNNNKNRIYPLLVGPELRARKFISWELVAAAKELIQTSKDKEEIRYVEVRVPEIVVQNNTKLFRIRRSIFYMQRFLIDTKTQ